MLDPDGVLAAVLGAALALWLTRSRALLGAAAAALALVALALVAAAGLPIQDRYVFLTAAILCVFGGAGLFGWQTLERGHPHRRLWQGAAVVIVVAIAASIAWQVPRYHKTFASSTPADQSLGAQQRIADDLSALVASHAVTARCRPISVPFATPVPLLALRLHTSPANIVVAVLARGTYLAPASTAVFTEYQLDPNDAHRGPAAVAARLPPARAQPLLARLLRVAARGHARPRARSHGMDRAPCVEARSAVPPPSRAPVGVLPSRLPAPA